MHFSVDSFGSMFDFNNNDNATTTMQSSSESTDALATVGRRVSLVTLLLSTVQPAMCTGSGFSWAYVVSIDSFLGWIHIDILWFIFYIFFVFCGCMRMLRF